ncbi:hypothetical protein [Chitinophaga sp.]|uniref:hypothetical protein n=1 Tax=Chitinophaga sp. TaxID=1869181 RepID=UPI002F91C7E5
MKKFFVAPFAGHANAMVSKTYVLGLSAVLLVSSTKAADKMNFDLHKAGHFTTIPSRAAFSVAITVNLSVTPSKPLIIYFTPVGGGETISLLCFDTYTSSSVPAGVYNVKFSIPTSANPFSQVALGSTVLWITPFPGLPTVSGCEISNLSVSSAVTINVS